MGTIMDELIARKLATLGFAEDESQVGFIRGVIEEDMLESEDKKEAIVGILEPPEDADADKIAIGVEELLVESKQLQAEEEERRRLEEEERKREAAKSPEKKTETLSPEELARRKEELIREYGLIEEEAEKELAARLEPNLNAAAVKGAELARRQEDAEKARAKREKDKYDLKKQKDDAERKKQDRQKKAAKQERRA